MAKLPNWARLNRNKWKYRGQKRPAFARNPKKGEESVWDYPRPPKIVKDYRVVKVLAGEHPLAETAEALRILETASPPTFYIPPSDVELERLVKSGKNTRCEWKGMATYWHIKTDDDLIRNAAWSYPEPFEDFKQIAGYFSFYPAKVTCYVGTEKVKPQPGTFYGGWMTSEIVGPVKQEPGITG